MSPPPAFKVAPGINSYDWGKRGSASLAAQYARESVPDFTIVQDKPYAELWMGTHPSNPSRTATGLLSEYLAAHPNLIGSKVAHKFPDTRDGALPFLFKVLSIGTALSIQAHPDKTLASQLHKERPDIYKDPNHKPEMAIALTPFRAFLNFVPGPILLQNLITVPELGDIVPEDAIDKLAKSLGLPTSHDAVDKAAQGPFEPTTNAQKAAIKAVFSAVMHATKEQYEGAIEKLVRRYKSGKIAPCEERLRELVITLDEQYPADVGTLCVFLLNVIDLETGQAVFLGANVPHAYICGDIIECMATSDNVVRAGLTPKLRDVPTLVDMLTYEAGPAEKQELQPHEFNRDPTTLLYDPPIDEFSVLRVHLARDEMTTHRPIEGPSIAIITNGEALIKWAGSGSIPVARGDVIFMGAGVEYKWQATQDTEAFRAFVEA
ncbi:hypothetical protein CspHIS471_0101930 [Cutaneotrichosporon sp. HIS471]|nr:hypothetical protein CspHIS471_0101930 [Cutaneotrichosporon sp. HIS471]